MSLHSTRLSPAHLSCWTMLLLPITLQAAPAVSSRPATVPQCTQVHLSAAYLAEAGGSRHAGFLLRIINDGDSAIALAQPFPTSVQWYARNAAGHWSWRASSGGGGALVDALREHGPVIAYPSASDGPTPELLQVPAHGSLEVETALESNPALRFRPGCQRCLNPGEDRYQAVLAYAHLPPSETGNRELLSCGLRSNMVIMPPLP